MILKTIRVLRATMLTCQLQIGQNMSSNTRLLTYAELRTEKIKLARSTLWALEKQQRFPLRRVHGGRVYWVESEIDEWLAKLPTKQEQTA